MVDLWRAQQSNWDAESISQANRVCSIVYEDLLSELTADLNELHSIKWDLQQYRRLLGFWLLHFVHVIYDRWQGIEHLSDAFLDKPPIADILSPPCNLDGRVNYFTSDQWNTQISYQLAVLRSSGELGTNSLPNTVLLSNDFDVVNDLGKPISVYAPYHYYGRSFQSNRVLSHVGLRIPRRLGPFVQPISFRTHPANTFPTNLHWRLSESNRDVSDFSDACSTLARRHLPAPYIEGFRPMANKASSLRFPSLYTATAMHYSAPFQFISAVSNDHTKLLLHQHGGNYGIDHSLINETLERSVSDTFYTWGWKEDEGTRPLPVPPRIARSFHRARRGILLKVMEWPRYVYEIDYKPQPLSAEEDIESTIRFLRDLSNTEFFVKFPSYTYGWDLRQRLNQAQISILEPTRPDSTFALHVANYLGSSWLESLAANIPTICFYHPKVHLFRSAVQSHMEDLTRVGILHTSPKSASDMVLRVHSDPVSWWRTDEVQEIRQSFVENYARLETNWLDCWEDEFARVASTLNS